MIVVVESYERKAANIPKYAGLGHVLNNVKLSPLAKEIVLVWVYA